MKRYAPIVLIAILAAAVTALAQGPDAPPAPTPAPTPAPADRVPAPVPPTPVPPAPDKSAEHFLGLCEQLRSADGAARNAIINELKQAQPSAALPVINAALMEKDVALQKRIAGLIAQLGDPEWVRRIDAHKELIGIGARAMEQVILGKKHRDREIAYRCTEIEKALNSIMKDELYRRKRQFTALLRVVKAFADKSSLECLHRLADETDQQIRRCAVDAIATIADPSSLDILFKALGDEELSVMCLGLWGIGRIDDPRAPEMLISIARDTKKNAFLRRTAAYALQEKSYKKAVDDLIPLLEDEIFDVRYVVFNVVRSLTGCKETFGYDYIGSDDEAKKARAEAVAKLKKWWAKNRPAVKPATKP